MQDISAQRPSSAAYKTLYAHYVVLYAADEGLRAETSCIQLVLKCMLSTHGGGTKGIPLLWCHLVSPNSFTLYIANGGGSNGEAASSTSGDKEVSQPEV